MRVGRCVTGVRCSQTAISLWTALGTVCLCLVAVSVLFSGCRQQPQKPPQQPAVTTPAVESPAAPSEETSGTFSPAVAAALAQFNRGAGLMEQYKYVEAAKAFDTVLQTAPDWSAARFNLGLAYFNMHGTRGGQAHLETCREAFEAVLAAEENHVHARFCLGLYHQHLGNTAEALEHFEAVHQSDPHDPHAAYKYAESLISEGRNEEGTKMLERVVQLDPGFVSAVYRLAQQYVRAKHRDKAMPLFDRFKRLSAAELPGGVFSVGKVYGASGKYYLALGADNLPIESPRTTDVSRVVFSPQTRPLDKAAVTWKWSAGTVGLPGIAVGDVDQDGDLDLCLAGLGEEGATSLWLNDGTGTFSEGSRIASHGVSPCFGDVDNDGDLDLWLGRAGADVLFVNDGKGNMTEAELPAANGDESMTVCARLLDIDSDGDLDLAAFGLAAGSLPVAGGEVPAVSRLWNNNRDGSWDEIATELGLALADTPVAAVVYDDFDNDRDADLVVFPAGDRQPLAWVNDRVRQYHLLDAAATGLVGDGVISATSGDPDKDGDRDLLVFDREGMKLLRNNGRFVFESDARFADGCGRLGGTGGQFADMDNDGDLDIVVADAHRRDGSRGPVLLINDWPRNRFVNAAELDPGILLEAIQTGANAGCVAADFTGNGRCDLLLTPAGAAPLLLENITPGGNWVQLDLRGTRPPDKKSRSNRSAIGARVEVKAGTVFQQFVVSGPSGPAAMQPLRIHVGLGPHPKIDWLRVIWPDGVLQAELEIAAGQVMAVTELQRKTSSCPHLFAWNGSHFQFVADFGGMGGLGYWIAPSTYAKPDPTEYVPLGHLEPIDGHYVLQILEPLEEVVYFDEAKLVAVDHPIATEVYPHEMMAVGAAPPPFEVFCFDRPIEPVRAVDHLGDDVTDRIRRIDRRYAGATRPDPRFMGLAEEHCVELDFGDRLDALDPDARAILFLHGWVEYGYSSTNYAAAQAGLRGEAPSFHVWRDGRWVEIFHEVGYPAGLQHMMTLDMTGKLRPGDRRIRISSNMELYWDRIFLATHSSTAVLSIDEVAATGADLHFLGYPREYSPDGRHPNLYDYGNIDRAVAWKLMEGRYTRYGEVGELLDRADDCFVIFGRGEELTLRFPADAFGPIPDGCRRSFLLKTDSYCKDMDLCTAHSESVEPLPFHGMSGYPYGSDEHYPDNERTRQYRRRFNTRTVRTR